MVTKGCGEGGVGSGCLTDTGLQYGMTEMFWRWEGGDGYTTLSVLHADELYT